jgi:hypothetical protein
MRIILGYDIKSYNAQILFINSNDDGRILFELSDSNRNSYKEHVLSENEIKELINFLQDDLDSRKKANVD